MQISTQTLPFDADEEDTTVHKGELAVVTTLPSIQGYRPSNKRIASLGLTATPETKSASTAADSSPRGSLTDSDSCAEKVAELRINARLTGPQLAEEVEEEEKDQSLLKAHSQTQTVFQAMSMTLAETM